MVDTLEKSLSIKSSQGPIQIGPPGSHSIRELANLISGLSGKNLSPKFDPSMPKGDHDRVGDFSRAAEVLGWSPTTALRDGLEQTLAWAKSELIK